MKMDFEMLDIPRWNQSKMGRCFMGEEGDGGSGSGSGSGGGNGGEGEGVNNDSKTPISVEHRALFDEKFKYYEDVAKSYKEIESYKSRIENEKGQVQQKVSEYEEVITDLQEQLNQLRVMGKGNSDAGRQAKSDIETAKAELDAYIEEKINKSKEKEQQEKGLKEQQDKFHNDDKFFATKYGQEKWEKEIRPQLAELWKTRKHIYDLRELVAIWKDQREDKERDLEREAERKKNDKNGAQSESGKGGTVPKNLLERIAAAESVKDLDKIK